MTAKAVSSWSIDRTLGRPRIEAGLGAHRVAGLVGGAQGAGLSLLDLPAELRRRGYDTVQLCHFHLPSRDESYLIELRDSLADSDITLDALLVDDGDLTHPDAGDDHESWIAGWLDDATVLGARRARVIAGRAAPTDVTLAVSATRLHRLATEHESIRLVTENWHELTPGPAEVLGLLDRTDGAVGLLIDLGNWSGPAKYADLAEIASFAETCHAKCHFTGPNPDDEDYARSLAVLRDADYAGPLALVYDGEDPDEWSSLELEHRIVTDVFAR